MSSTGPTKANEQVIDLSSPRQWNAVKLPLRMSMLEVITALGGATARELADVIGRPVSLVHYHLGVLAKAGLLKASVVPGKAGRMYTTTGRRLVVVHDIKSKTQVARAHQLVGNRLNHSMDIIQSNLGEGQSRVLSHWESLTRAEYKEVVKHFDQVDRILSRARRRRRRQGLAEQRATSHVVFAVEPVEGVMPPTPRVDVRSRP
ncbi:MAG: helix-turn-helix domain-containing protein [Planctomycetota bacterium]|nr:helix-turn-helix domain-containing protein [Planctomycetota bacterium]